MPSLNSPLSLFNWVKKVSFMARMCPEDAEMCSTLILKVISTKIKPVTVTYPVATNTAIYMTIMAIIIWSEAVSVLDYCAISTVASWGVMCYAIWPND